MNCKLRKKHVNSAKESTAFKSHTKSKEDDSSEVELVHEEQVPNESNNIGVRRSLHHIITQV